MVTKWRLNHFHHAPMSLYIMRTYKSLVTKMAKVKQICEQCEKAFEAYSSSHRKFCSSKCHDESRKRRIKRTCKYCGKEFETKLGEFERGNAIFCSQKCQYEWLHERRGNMHPLWKDKIKRICQQCGKKFEVFPSRIKYGYGKFCSHKCSGKWQMENANRIKKMRMGNIKPTKPERIFQEICNRNNLSFRYVGDGELWIGKDKKLNPDFVECNGKKIVIEIFGRYWHSPLLNRNLREDAGLEYRRKHYKRFKWKPVFIWDTDLLRKDGEQFVLNELKKEGVI